jgi:hypothetical protein
MATLEDLQDTLLALMARVEELECQLRGTEHVLQANLPEVPDQPPAIEPELGEDQDAQIGRQFVQATTNMEW